MFAQRPGAVAAPTASLHFDEAVLAALAARGIGRAELTLHVGAGTFQPVRSATLAEHKMHSEWYEVGEATVAAIARTRAAGGLLGFGVGLGPDGLNLIRPRSLGQEALFGIVDLAVAVILFEGGLNLERSRLRRAQMSIRRTPSMTNCPKSTTAIMMSHGGYGPSGRRTSVDCWKLTRSGSYLTQTLTSPSTFAAGRFSWIWKTVRQRISESLPNWCSDESSLVRLYLASALQQLPLEDRWAIAEGLLRHGDDAVDQNLPLMIWYGVEPLVVADPTRALTLAAASRIPQVRQFIYRRAAADPAAINELLAALSKTDDAGVQRMMLAEIAAAVSKQGKLKMPDGWPAVYTKLAAMDDQQVREHAQLITVKFGDSSIFPVLREIVANKQAKPSSRQNALAALISGKDNELPPVLISLLDDAEMRGAAIRGLAGYDHAATAEAIVGKYASFAASEQSDAVLTLVSRTAFAAKLLDAVEKELIPRKDLSAVAIRQIELLGDQALVEKVNEVWGTMRSTPAEKKAKIDALKKQLAPKVIAKADLSHGRLVYDNVCGKCHRLFGSGGEIGPDITGSNRADLEYTLQNMIDPNA